MPEVVTKADRAVAAGVLVAIAVMGLYSVRVGTIVMGLAFVGAALARRSGVAGALFTSRRKKVDIAVLATFAVALITLAAVLPR